jgi:outer membrane lipoprotein SlyB
MKKSTLAYFAVFGLVLSICGCARDISQSTYETKTVGEASEAHPCVVISTRRVQVASENLDDNKTGIIGGAIAGGALGNTIGKGRGRTLATAAGALGGSIAGAFLEKNLKSQEGIEYLVKLTKSGEMRTVVQGTDSLLYPGQNALLIVSRGRSRLIRKLHTCTAR